MMELPRTMRRNIFWVIINRLTKSYFLAVRAKLYLEIIVKLYTVEIVKLHRIPKAIVLDRDLRFTSRFWHAFQSALSTRIKISIAFYPHIDGHTERIIATLEDMLKACALEWQGEWDNHLKLDEFAYNNSYYINIRMTPFEALYGRLCQSSSCWSDIADR